MKIKHALLPLCFLLAAALEAQTIPTFNGSFLSNGKRYSYTIAGEDPQSNATTTIPVVLVALSLSFETSLDHAALNASAAIPEIVRSPLFKPFPFATGNTQYADAVQRAEFAAKPEWHTLLGKPQLAAPVQIDIPASNGYLLHSARSGKSLAVADLDFVQKQLFEQLPKLGAGPGKLLMAITKNVAFYSLSDATVCCAVGAHGQLSGQPFVLASYFESGVKPGYTDIQAISQQIAEWMNDPLHGERSNQFPAWLEPPANLSCGGRGESSSYLFEQPTDSLAGGNATRIAVNGKVYHLENMALLSWFGGSPRHPFSFPDTKALSVAAQPCAVTRQAEVEPSAAPLARSGKSNGHALIGYWEGYSSVKHPIPLRDVSPQWDIVIATFAAPVKGSTSLLQFAPPPGLNPQQFKTDVAYLQNKGKKVLISLGGGGEVVTLNTSEDLHNFVSSVSAIVEKYGFDGIDLDIETPSLLIDRGDTDFRHPTTPSVVNLIAGVRQLRNHFGPKFMLSEVPEAAQTQAGMQAYGGQFGSFLPVIYGTRDILSFVDAQDYNTPPLEALDGNYYFPGKADYHVAVSEMLVHGFAVAGPAKAFFPPLPPEKVAIGLPATPTSARNYTPIPAIENALRYIVTGRGYAGAEYKLRQSDGYPTFLGAMFWAINEDRRNNYRTSNAIGPLLHGFPAGR